MRLHTKSPALLPLLLATAMTTAPAAGAGPTHRVAHPGRPEPARVIKASELPLALPSDADGETPRLVPNRLTGPDLQAETESNEFTRDERGGVFTVVSTRTEKGDGVDAGPPSVDVSFDGPYQSGLAPPDPVIAVGRNHVVSLINQRIEMYDKSGHRVYGPVSLRTFFGIPSGFSGYDPLAIHDPYADRFIVTNLADNDAAQDSRIYIAFSQTDDPTGDWNIYWIDADADQEGNWADYTSIGLDRLGVYITANMWTRADEFDNVTVFIYDQSDGFAGAALDNSHLIDVRAAGGGSPFTLRPAFVSAPTPGDEYYLAHTNTGFGSQLELFRLSGDRYASPTLAPSSVSLPGLFFGPDDARQPGDASVDTLGSQLWNVYHRNGRLLAAQAIAGSPDIPAWVHRIDVSQTPAVREETYEISVSGRDTFLPHVVPDHEDNDFAMLSAFSGDDLHVTGRYWNVGADGSVRHAETLATGTRANTSGRHGDYLAMYEDPTDGNRIWMIAQYMKNSSFSGNQVIASARFEDEAPPTSPPPVPDGKTTPGEQLEVSKAGAGELTLTWDASTCPASENHLVWYDLSAIASYDISEETCAIGTTGSWTGPAPEGAVAVIVVGDDIATATEGSHGVDSSGTERPSQSSVCASSKDTAGTCVP